MKNTFLRNVGLAAGSSRSKVQLLTLPEQLVAARVLVTKLTAEVDRLIADNKANEIVSSKVTADAPPEPRSKGLKKSVIHNH